MLGWERKQAIAFEKKIFEPSFPNLITLNKSNNILFMFSCTMSIKHAFDNQKFSFSFRKIG